MNSTNNIEAAYLGLVSFSKSLEIQQDLRELSEKNKSSYVMGLEHPAVVTLGYRAQAEDEVFDSELPVEKIQRGGLATIHSEGQLVIYPVMNLKELNLGPREYVRLLLETTQELLQQLGISSSVDDNAIGLYTANGKIAFCGIQIKNGISQHGLSLNVRNDLSLFTKIRSCGVSNPEFDSLARYGVSHTLKELYLMWVSIFRNRLS